MIALIPLCQCGLELIEIAPGVWECAMRPEHAGHDSYVEPCVECGAQNAIEAHECCTRDARCPFFPETRQ